MSSTYVERSLTVYVTLSVFVKQSLYRYVSFIDLVGTHDLGLIIPTQMIGSQACILGQNLLVISCWIPVEHSPSARQQ